MERGKDMELKTEKPKNETRHSLQWTWWEFVMDKVEDHVAKKAKAGVTFPYNVVPGDGWMVAGATI
jgi:hypothetical protein